MHDRLTTAQPRVRSFGVRRTGPSPTAVPAPRGCVLCADGLRATSFYTIGHRAVTWAASLAWCRACGRTWPTAQLAPQRAEVAA